MEQNFPYNHSEIEKYWNSAWDSVGWYTKDLGKAEKPFYNLMMFPYPSAEGLHVGNMYAFTGADFYGRFKAHQGYSVFEPIGLDGFGIHSENFALKIGRHPMEHAQITEKNFYKQLHTIGAMFDWTRTVETYDEDYYRWTQWLFVQMFQHGLAYRKTAQVNWCKSCKTVLADEQVIDDACERCGNKVEKKALEQWFFKITEFAEKLHANISHLNWSEKVKIAQDNWIGKKEGIEITYKVVDKEGKAVAGVETITCFTTRPDTNFGATFVVVAPEYNVITQIINKEIRVPEEIRTAIANYVNKTATRTPQERIAEGRVKTGVYSGLYCVNDLTGYRMPVYVADFVLASFGTGAVVGVPGHDKRDFAFAQTFSLPIQRVVVAQDGDRSEITSLDQVQEEDGTMINSGFLDGMNIHDATVKMMDYMEEKKMGRRVTTYHLRDWLISRQRYWGPPIPMIYCEFCAHNKMSWFTTNEGKNMAAKHQVTDEFLGNARGWYPVSDDQLPLVLPRIEDYKPKGEGKGPLSDHKEFYETQCPHCGSKAVRETDVSDTFLDSSWYFLRYPSLNSQSSKNKPFDTELTKKWLPIAMYTGGAEHSVLHLMYSRFVTMALHDWGYIDFDEPFTNFFAHGLVIKDGAKMSKSKGNVVNPDEYIALYGADSLRMYLMFMGPFKDGGDFRDTAMEGVYRWTGRVWRLINTSAKRKLDHTDDQIENRLHRVIKKVGNDLEARHYNTAIAAMMEFTNFVADHGGVLSVSQAERFVVIFSPFAPFVSEEMWMILHHRERHEVNPSNSVHAQPWPAFDEARITENESVIAIQINGKVRATCRIPTQSAHDTKTVETIARKDAKISTLLRGVQVIKVIVVPGKIVNFVVG